MTTDREPAPYAPIANVLSLIRRLRERGLPNPITFRELERLSIPTGNASRTLAAMRFLGLVDEDGNHVEAMDRLQRATTDQYQEVLAQIVRAAYSQVFAIVDPAQDPEPVIHDAFRHFQPPAQRGRMVTLFLGLCREAGITEGGPAPRSRSRSTQPRVQPQTTRLRLEGHPPSVEVGTGAAISHPNPTVIEDGADYRLLQVLMQRLPPDGRWTQAQRDRWLQAVASNVDVLVEVVPEGGDA